MREDPGLDPLAIAECLGRHYGLGVTSVTFLPLGYDLAANVFEVRADDGDAYFLKVHSGPVNTSALYVPAALVDLGVPNVLAPILTTASDVSCRFVDVANGPTVVLYPFIRGQSAMVSGLSDAQWRTFGATLRTVHDTGTGRGWQVGLRVDSFDLPSASQVRDLSTLVGGTAFEDPVASRLASFWRDRAGRIDDLIGRAETLGAALRGRSSERVPCHGDIHAANVLVAVDGSIRLVDWDAPIIAPRERDLIFVVGSRIAREVTPREEDLFFGGYGPVEIDPDALAYFRYERIVEDLGEFGRSALLDLSRAAATRSEEADQAMRFFAPGGDIDRAEVIPRRRW